MGTDPDMLIPDEGGYVDPAGDMFASAQNMDPLVLDLDGDGVELVSRAASRAFFDLDNDGFIEKTGWVGPDDALLAVDRDGDGRVADRSELFGGPDQDGFAALAAFDTSGDGRVDAADAGFGQLLVWQDRNGDGFSQAGELETLAQAGIASIGLSSTAVHQTIAGNDVTALGSFTRADGTTGTAADVSFSFSQRFTFDARPFGLNIEALLLPTLRGYGTISSLTAEMSRDPALLQMVRDFVDAPLSAATDASIRDILYRWAGVDGVDPAAHGTGIDGRKVAFLEKFFDGSFRGIGPNDAPTFGAAAAMEQSFATIFDAAKARLLVQGPLAGAFGPGAFDYLKDGFSAGIDLQDAIVRCGDVADSLQGGLEKMVWWSVAVAALDAVASQVAPDMGDYNNWISTAFAQSTNPALSADDLRGIDGSVVVGTVRADSMAGGSGADLFVGGFGGDYARGGGGGDVFVFQGHGRLEVDADAGSGSDSAAVLRLGPGTTAADIAVKGEMGNLTLTTGAAGAQVKIDGMMNVGYGGHAQYGVASVVLADGAVLTREQLLRMATTGTAGAADSLYGGSAGETFDGKGGGDCATGGGGADVFVFHRGYGQLEVRADAGSGSDSAAVLRLGPGIAAAELRATADRHGDLYLTIGAAGDRIKFEGMARPDWGGHARFGVASVQLDDGTVLTREQILRLATVGTAGDDTLIGGERSDTFNGGAGDDLLVGGGGGDVYRFGRGDGRDTIEYWSHGVDRDAVEFAAGVGPADVRAWRVNWSDLSLSVEGAPDELRLRGFFAASDPGGSAGEIRFADGTVWSMADLVAMAVDADDSVVGGGAADALSGGLGNDTLEGGDGDDTLEGGDDADYLVGQGGQDSIRGGRGDDTVQGDGADDAGDLIDGGEGRDEFAYYGGDDAVIDLAAGTTSSSAVLVGIEDVWGDFGNDLIRGDAGANRLRGYDGADTLEGGDGADSLEGEDGDDSLVGGAGDDSLEGDRGADVFAFGPGSGADVVSDFETGIDKIRLAGLGWTGFADVQANMSQTWGDTMITLGTGASIVLEYVPMSALTAEDFLFA